MTDPWVELAALDAREQQVLAWLADVRAQRLQILANLRDAQIAMPLDDLLGVEQLVRRWTEHNLPSPPASVAALMRRLQRAVRGDARWHSLRELGEKHQQGRHMRWPWSSARRIIAGE